MQGFEKTDFFIVEKVESLLKGVQLKHFLQVLGFQVLNFFIENQKPGRVPQSEDKEKTIFRSLRESKDQKLI